MQIVTLGSVWNHFCITSDIWMVKLLGVVTNINVIPGAKCLFLHLLLSNIQCPIMKTAVEEAQRVAPTTTAWEAAHTAAGQPAASEHNPRRHGDTVSLDRLDPILPVWPGTQSPEYICTLQVLLQQEQNMMKKTAQRSHGFSLFCWRACSVVPEG